MIPIDIQVSRSKGKIKGRAYSSHVGEGGIIVLQTFFLMCVFLITQLFWGMRKWGRKSG